MTSAPAPDFQFGVKLVRLWQQNTSWLKAGRFPVDYVEYPAPVLSQPHLSETLGIPPSRLRPHSVGLSTFSPDAPPRSVLRLLRQECERSHSPFLGEHIGYLNPRRGGPSLGYIFPPPLNRASAKVIAENVKIIQDSVGVPLALENPVFYASADASTLRWSQFILELSEHLPPRTGWLIDLAHMQASCFNIRAESMEAILAAYASTRRPVLEVHLAGLQLDRFVVAHDSHSAMAALPEAGRWLGGLSGAGLRPSCFTVEVERLAGQARAIKALRRALLADARSSIRRPAKAPRRRTSATVRRRREWGGRMRILLAQLQEQFLLPGRGIFDELARESGHADAEGLLSHFAGATSPWWFSRSLPYYSRGEWDGVDLTGCFLAFLSSVPSRPGLLSLRRKLLLKQAIRQAAVQAHRHKARKAVGVTLQLAAACGPLRAGTHWITVNAQDEIVAETLKSKNEGIDLLSYDSSR